MVPVVPVLTPLQRLLMDCPLASPSVTVQLVMVVEPELPTVTSAWKPPGHELTSR